MIALLSTLLGFLSSATPEILKLFEASGDRAHELALLQIQMAYDEKKLGVQAQGDNAERALRLQEIEIGADTAESAALNDRPGSGANKTGIEWVDALSGSVRPILTYAFFVLYFVVKCCEFHLLLSPSLPWVGPMTGAQAMVALWTEEDIAIFSAVVGFWFGNRTMQKAREFHAGLS
ncbi:MAG: hypothetical protein WDN72_04725 [Alphaproteobacteria bacterium]